MNLWKIGGILAIIVGSASLYFSGTSESMVAALVSAVFVVAGIIAALRKKNESTSK